MSGTDGLTYGRQRLPLSPRNAAIIAARQAPPPLLPTAHAPHVRDARLQAQRRAAARETSAGHVGHNTETRLLALLAGLAEAGAVLPCNQRLGDLVGLEYHAVSTAISDMVARGLLARVPARRGRALRIVAGGQVVASEDYQPVPDALAFARGRR